MLKVSLPGSERAEWYAGGFLSSQVSRLEGQFFFGCQTVARSSSVSAEANQGKDFVADIESGTGPLRSVRCGVVCWQGDDSTADVVARDCRRSTLRGQSLRPG